MQHRIAADLANDDVVLKKAKAKVVKRLEKLRISVLELPEQAADEAAENLQKSGAFNFVEQDFTARGAILPNDPSSGSQWHLSNIQAQSAWDMTTGSTAVPIAIVDSGVDASHPDLSGKLMGGWNFLSSNSDTSDVLGHGTAVAGSAAAATDNGIGVAGVAWRNPILPLVVLNSSNYAAYSDIANAIVYAADHGVRIINVSICGTSASSTLQSAIDYAWNKGSLVFAAAGNASTSALTYPAACDRAIAVSATNSDDTLSSFSNYGSWISLAAPGNLILTTTRGGGYGQWNGTSFASPIAAGVAALALSARPSLDRDTLLRLIEENTDDLAATGFDNSFGSGRVNADKTVRAAAALSTDSYPPAVTIYSPAQNAILSGIVSVTAVSSDNIGVLSCSLYVDAQLQSTQAPQVTFAWDTRKFANGPHSVAISCKDAGGNVGQASVSVTVNNPAVVDLVAPSITLTSPTPNSRVDGQVKISAAATDNLAVSQVCLYVDNVQVYSSTATGPYQYTWNTKKVAVGSHTITARAWDRAGNVGATSMVVIH